MIDTLWPFCALEKAGHSFLNLNIGSFKKLKGWEVISMEGSVELSTSVSAGRVSCECVRACVESGAPCILGRAKQARMPAASLGGDECVDGFCVFS